jgi:hypothetical protein
MEGFSMPQFTKRTAGAACKALPHGAIALQAVGSLIFQPCSSALPGLWFTGLPDLPQTPTPQDSMISAGPCLPGLTSQQSISTHNFCWAAPLRPARLVIHRPTWFPPWCAPQAFQALNPQAHIFSTPLARAPQACQAHTPKALLYSLNNSLCPQARGTPLTCHLPQKGSKPGEETQTGLDAKGVTEKLLRLKLYGSWTSDIFFLFIYLIYFFAFL